MLNLNVNLFNIRAVSWLLPLVLLNLHAPYKRKTPWFSDQSAIYGRGRTRTADFTDVNRTNSKTRNLRF